MSSTVNRRKRKNPKSIEEPINFNELESNIDKLNFQDFDVEDYLKKYKLYEDVIRKREIEIVNYKNKFDKLCESSLNQDSANKDITFQKGIDEMTKVLDYLESNESKDIDFSKVLQMYSSIRDIMYSLEQKMKDAELQLVQVN